MKLKLDSRAWIGFVLLTALMVFNASLLWDYSSDAALSVAVGIAVAFVIGFVTVHSSAIELVDSKDGKKDPVKPVADDDKVTVQPLYGEWKSNDKSEQAFHIGYDGEWKVDVYGDNFEVDSPTGTGSDFIHFKPKAVNRSFSPKTGYAYVYPIGESSKKATVRLVQQGAVKKPAPVDPVEISSSPLPGLKTEKD